MTMGEFRMRITALSFIDRDMLTNTGKVNTVALANSVTPEIMWPDARWIAFRDHPIRFFMREATPAERDDIWRASDKFAEQLAAQKYLNPEAKPEK